MRGDYSNGRIYFIEPICDHEDNEVYYGSTLQKLCKRMDKHRRDFKYWKDGKRTKITCFDLFEKYGLENCKIYLVELYPCKSREELESREGYYIRNYDCVNKNIAGRTRNEWCIDNTEYMRDYYNNNKDKIKENAKEYYYNNKDIILTKHECVCGGRYTCIHKTQHSKTKKHMKYEEEQKSKKK
jgi:hypothetical protein